MKGQRNKERIETCKINEFSKKGNGVGFAEKDDGRKIPVEVPFTAPGETVTAQIMPKKGNIHQGKLKEIVVASPDRIAPRCIHFGSCGGCRLQHISYQQQLEHKETYVRNCFEKLLTPETKFYSIIGCNEPWYYRNKMEFSFSSDIAGNKYLGLIMDSSRGKVFNLTECHLVHGWFSTAVEAVRQWWKESGLDAYHPPKDLGSLRTLTLREGIRTGDRLAVLTVSGNAQFALNKQHLESFVAFLRAAIEPTQANSFLSIYLRIQQIGKGMSTNFYEMLLHGSDHIREILEINVDPTTPPRSIVFNISPSAFFQPNTRQAEQLYSQTLLLAQIPKDSVVYDIYCGTGTFGICMSPHVKQVISIELSPESALDARTNAQRNGCQNVTVISGAVRHVLRQIMEHKNLPLPDVVLVDPPRPGLEPEAMQQLLELKPPKIIYVSCNPSTQAPNVAELVQNGYRITAIQPIDQFPQTYHVENIVVLTKEA